MLTHEIDLFYYTKRDSQVMTPIGWATVASYREEDQMLIVTLPFCRPAARMSIPVEKVMATLIDGRQDGLIIFVTGCGINICVRIRFASVYPRDPEKNIEHYCLF